MRKKYFNSTLANILLGLILGIVLQYFCTLRLSALIVLSVVCVGGLVVSFFFFKPLFPKINLLSCTVLGAVTYFVHYQPNYRNHYTHTIEPYKAYVFNGDIQQIINPYTAQVRLNSAGEIPLSGSIALSFGIDSLQPSMVGKNITFYGSLRPITAPKNPYQMNYKSYMQRRNIFWQGKTSTFVLQQSERISMVVLGQKVQQFFVNKLSKYPFSEQSIGVINALLLGNRLQISSETYQNYIDAGAVHILAISGLHIGIITVIISSILNFFFPSKKYNLGKVSCIILLLGGYSLLTGLSGSVLRASVMFGFLSIGSLLNKQQGKFDNILLAGFVLLLFQPFFLFDVGFQLSFLAVIAIVAFEPIAAEFAPKKKILLFFYNIFSVSLMAQMGVLPLSLYYFHQFPALFFLTNLLILPFLSFVLTIGLVVILLASVNGLPLWLCVFYDGIISLINSIVAFIARFESFVFRNIYFDGGTLAITLTALFLCWWGLFHKKKSAVWGCFLAIFTLQGYLFYLKYQWHTSKSLSVYYQYNQSAIFVKDGRQGYFINTSVQQIPSKIIHFLQQKHQLNHIFSKNMGHLFSFEGKKILIVEKPFYFDSPIVVDYLILQQNPTFHFEKFLQNCHAKHIVTDGTSSYYFINQWEKVAREKNIPFHNAYEKGYFEIH